MMFDKHQRQKYLNELSETFDLLLSDTGLLEEFQSEVKLWECTSADGLVTEYDTNQKT